MIRNKKSRARQSTKVNRRPFSRSKGVFLNARNRFKLNKHRTKAQLRFFLLSCCAIILLFIVVSFFRWLFVTSPSYTQDAVPNINQVNSNTNTNSNNKIRNDINGDGTNKGDININTNKNSNNIDIYNIDTRESEKDNQIDFIFEIDGIEIDILGERDFLNHVRCRTSMFRIAHNYCCFNQFIHKQMANLGFTHRMRNGGTNKYLLYTMYASSNNAFDYSCYGLDIHGTASWTFRELKLIYEKTQLFTTVIEYTNYFNIDNTFLPKSFHMNRYNDRKEFFKQLSCNLETSQNSGNNNNGNNDKNETTIKWIVKTNEHRGTGIRIIDDPRILRRLFLPPNEISKIGENIYGEICDINDIEYIKNPNEIERKYKFPVNRKKGAIRIIDDNTGGNKDIFLADTSQIIMQEFISNPLLIRNNKFHMRSFFMVAHYRSPFILLYCGSIVIISSEKYDKHHLSKNNAITNRAVSKKNVKHNENILLNENNYDDWTWNLNMLQNYINQAIDSIDTIDDFTQQDKQFQEKHFGEWQWSQLKNEKYNVENSSNWVQTGFVSQIQRICKIVWQSARFDFQRLKNDKKNDDSDSDNGDDSDEYSYPGMPSLFTKEGETKWETNFEYLALDSLITDEFQVKLMEVQNGPASSFIPENCNDKYDLTTKKRKWACYFGNQMAKEMMNIATEIALKKALFQKIEKLETLETFEIVDWDWSHPID